jgi:predicted flavoprotein YhiN
MSKEFKMSMFASAEDLYKAKSEYFEQQVTELTEKLAAAEAREMSAHCIHCGNTLFTTCGDALAEALAKERQAKRDEVLKELSEQEPQQIVVNIAGVSFPIKLTGRLIIRPEAPKENK